MKSHDPRMRFVDLKVEYLETRIALSFGPAANYGVGNAPQSIISGDFNEDAATDLVTANYNSSSITVMLGNGNGTFKTGQNWPTDTSPCALATGDLNEDGNLDILTGNISSNQANVLLGNGNGTFKPWTGISLSGANCSISLDDFNSDGNLDAAFGVATQSMVLLMLGNGNGTFEPYTSYSTGNSPGQGVYDIASADLNDDGAVDLATANHVSHNVSVLMGPGDGTFQGAVNYPVGNNPTSIVIANFNADGEDDLATGNGANNVTALMGNGDGTLQPGKNSGVSEPQGVAAADFNGDGVDDLAMGNYSAQTVSVLIGNGNGTFQNPAPYPVGAIPLSVAVADFNGDSAPDIATANSGSNTVSVLLNTSVATHFDITAVPFATAGNRFRITVTALDEFNNQFANYTGTVHFTSSDPAAFLPSDYTFTLGDGGKHIFTVKLYTAGNEIISATDTLVSTITGSASVNVKPGAAKTLVVAGFPSPVTVGTVHTFTVTAKDAFGNVATGYVGTVHFSSTDVSAILPADYTFTASDGGTKVFGGVFMTLGTHDLAGTDTASANITGSQLGILVEPGRDWQTHPRPLRREKRA